MPRLHITLDSDTRSRYRCDPCQRTFTVHSDAARWGTVRCPACLSDDVAPWLSRRDRLLSWLMAYEAT